MENTTDNSFETPQDVPVESTAETPIVTPTETTAEAPQPQQYYYQPPEVNLVLAGRGLRFANYLIDLIVFYIVLIVGGGLIIGIFFPAYAADLEEMNPLLDRIITLLFYGMYMSIVEVMTQGRSLGKYITGTKAVNHDGTPISAATAFGRGFSRMVPFDQISALGDPPSPWHDQWNNTHVVVIKSSTLP
ncbi:RDD family protein [Parasediminibacterium paludis]|uniref:RDD family protein n=1 Tax=Parasediminibacterium paludis TaxID=908966 RepID=A0ABV8PU61_9BACT